VKKPILFRRGIPSSHGRRSYEKNAIPRREANGAPSASAGNDGLIGESKGQFDSAEYAAKAYSEGGRSSLWNNFSPSTAYKVLSITSRKRSGKRSRILERITS